MKQILIREAFTINSFFREGELPSPSSFLDVVNLNSNDLVLRVTKNDEDNFVLDTSGLEQGFFYVLKYKDEQNEIVFEETALAVLKEIKFFVFKTDLTQEDERAFNSTRQTIQSKIKESGDNNFKIIDTNFLSSYNFENAVLEIPIENGQIGRGFDICKREVLRVDENTIYFKPENEGAVERVTTGEFFNCVLSYEPKLKTAFFKVLEDFKIKVCDFNSNYSSDYRQNGNYFFPVEILDKTILNRLVVLNFFINIYKTILTNDSAREIRLKELMREYFSKLNKILKVLDLRTNAITGRVASSSVAVKI